MKRLLRLGNSELQKKAQPVTDFDTPELHRLVKELFNTMKANGGVGIAAPQVGVPLQVVVFGFQKSERYPHANPVSETVMINPSYKSEDGVTYEDWEGCLSVKGLRGLVKRYQNISFNWYDVQGNYHEDKASGFRARIIQHEIDHLNGMLFIERIADLKYFGFEDEIQAIMKETGTKLA